MAPKMRQSLEIDVAAQRSIIYSRKQSPENTTPVFQITEKKKREKISMFSSEQRVDTDDSPPDLTTSSHKK